jgi:hypothetical protein
MDGSIFKHQMTYDSALKKWNDKVFGKALFAKPAVGTQAHKEVKDIQIGKPPVSHTKISELTKDAKKSSEEPNEKKATKKQEDKEKGKKLKANMKESAVQRKIKKIMSADVKEIKSEMEAIKKKYGGKEPPAPTSEIKPE